MAFRILTTARDIATLAAVTGAGMWLLGVGLVLIERATL